MVFVTRDILAHDLRSYGEDALAERVLTVSDDELRRIWERADHYVPVPSLDKLGVTGSSPVPPIPRKPRKRRR